MIESVAPALPRPVIFDQQWRNVAFLHWPVDPAGIAQFFPTGSWPDMIDGRTYVGLIPFELRRAGPGRFLPVPYFGDFLETNVRLYSVDAEGRHGVVFLSLDTQRLAVVALARSTFGVPYTWARMRSAIVADVHSYFSTRRWPCRGVTSRVSVSVGERVEPSALEVWLTSRWGLHTRIAGRTMWVPNAHPPWPLHRASVLALDDGLMESAGVAVEGPPSSVLWSPGVRARFGRPVAVRAPQRGRGVRAVAIRRRTRPVPI
ncbi:MAG: DUF2071 domain-containing protein [Actinomycetota bacterium]